MRSKTVISIFFVLSIVWFGISTLSFQNLVRPTTLVDYIPVQEGITFPDAMIGKHPLVQTFTATEDNLGSIAVRFHSINRIEHIGLVFRIREKGNQDWQYEHAYYLFPFEQDALFPFGFPPMGESKGKIYEFEISQIGRKDKAVLVGAKDPSVMILYHTPLSELKKRGVGRMYQFLTHKIKNTLGNRDVFRNFSVLFLPIILLSLSFFRKGKQRRLYLLSIPYSLIFLDTIGIISVSLDIKLLFVAGTLFVSYAVYGIDGSSVFSIGTILMMVNMLLLLFGYEDTAVRLSYYLYIHVFLGILLLFWNRKRQQYVMKDKFWKACAVLWFFTMIIGSMYMLGKSTSVSPLFHHFSVGNPVVTSVSPSFAYQESVITVRGNNFGHKYTGEKRLMSTYGEIEDMEWSNDAVTFRIPSSWHPGNVSLWFSWYTSREAVTEAGTSSELHMTVLDYNTAWDQNDDEYYSRIGTCSAQVKKNNGFMYEFSF